MLWGVSAVGVGAHPRGAYLCVPVVSAFSHTHGADTVYIHRSGWFRLVTQRVRSHSLLLWRDSAMEINRQVRHECFKVGSFVFQNVCIRCIR